MHDELKSKVATACRILGTQGFEEYGFAGHVSARIPNTNKFVVFGHVHYHEFGKGMADAMPDHVITVDLKGNKIEGNYPPVGELIIHTSVYNARPDVMAIVHCHPPTIVAFSVVPGEVLPINVNYMVPLRKGVSKFDLGPRVILTEDDGKALVKAIGNRAAAIQKGHGIVSVGESVEEAVINTIFIEKSLKLQIQASHFGEISSFESLETDYGAKSVKEGETVKELINEFYNYYVRKVSELNPNR